MTSCTVQASRDPDIAGNKVGLIIVEFISYMDEKSTYRRAFVSSTGSAPWEVADTCKNALQLELLFLLTI